MSHNINAIITYKTDEVLDQFPNGRTLRGSAAGKKLYLIVNKEKNIKHLKDNNITFLTISTDYFGGSGTQTCSLFRDNKSFKKDSINAGLQYLGVKPDKDLDEFDTVGLGNYRENEDIDPSFVNK